MTTAKQPARDTVSEVLRVAAERQYDGGLVRFGLPCPITLKPVRMEATDDGS